LMYFLRGSLPWQGLKATTKKQKYQRILERKQATHPEQLCKGYAVEFRDYFAHCLSLGFEDRPDYRYLKKMFRDLFERQSFEDDGVFDWDIIKKQQASAGADANVDLTAADIRAAGEGGLAANNTQDIANLQGGSARPSNNAANGGTGGERSTSQRETNPAVNRVSAPMNEDGSNGNGNDQGDLREQGQRRSIISSIRHSLFGSRGGANQPAGPQVGQAAGSNKR